LVGSPLGIALAGMYDHVSIGGAEIMLNFLPPVGILIVGVPDCPETILAHTSNRVKMKG
jgi:hypothetical protein